MKKAKEHSTSFYLSPILLEKIQTHAQMLNISRSVLVERAIFGKEKGYEKAEHTITTRKKKKEILAKRGKHQTDKYSSTQAQNQQKCLFDFVCGRLSYICV